MIEIKKLSVSYLSDKKKVLNELSFTVSEGEIVAIMGPSGCGKTTLLRAILGTLPSSVALVSGKVSFSEGHKIRLVFQEPRLIPWQNVAKNVAFGLRAKNMPASVQKERIDKVLRMVSLTKNASYLPGQLSLGMQQRVNFARALVCNPDTILLDEPFSALDEATKKPIIAKFRDIIKQQHITAIFVTHNSEEAEQLADRTITLNRDFISVHSHKTLPVIELDSYSDLLDGEF